jgi:predicted SAM-dependent methyltransferase
VLGAQLAKRSALLLALVRAARYGFTQYITERQIARWVRERQARIEKCLASCTPLGLQLGAGPHGLRGWLNTDLKPPSDSVVYVDVTKTFPFDDGVFDYVYSEHLIEHLTYDDGRFMLRECYRVLKPGGTLRIATPNLANLIALFGPEKTDMQQRYMRYAVDRHLHGRVPYREVFVLNNFFYNWEHRFIYDATTLRDCLDGCGFAAVSERAPGCSDDAHLVGIEQHGRSIGEDMNIFETMVFEAHKPFGSAAANRASAS